MFTLVINLYFNLILSIVSISMANATANTQWRSHIDAIAIAPHASTFNKHATLHTIVPRNTRPTYYSVTQHYILECHATLHTIDYSALSQLCYTRSTGFLMNHSRKRSIV